MRYEITEDGRRQLTKTQCTFFEFVEGSNAEGNEHHSSNNSGSSDFYGDIRSYKDMYKACYNGMNVKEMSKVRANLNNLVNHEVETPRKAVVGETLNVSAFCEGSPYHFYKDADEYGKPRVHLTYSTNATAGVRSNQFIRHGASICALVDQLAEQVDIKLSLYITNRGVLGGNGCQVITIKDYDETIDIARVSATAHPSFFRRIGFSWFENARKLIDPRCSKGYGGSMTGSNRKGVISDEDFQEWVGMSNDEMLIDFPAPDEYQFNDDDYTAEWLNQAVKKIETAVDNGDSICKVYGIGI